MSWLLWRQHRWQLALAALAVAVFTIPVVVTGVNLADQLAACRGDSSCGGINLLSGFRFINPLIDLTVVVPLLLGLFWGTTIVGRELETATATLVWTQSTTRRHWLVTKLVTLFAAAGVASAAVAILVTWWSDPHNATVESRFSGLQFDIQGLAPVGYALFAVALGLLAGALWRRTLPAMATTIAGFVGLRLVVEVFLRQYYASPVTLTGSLGKMLEVPSGGWTISTDITLHGKVVTGPIVTPTSCDGSPGREAMDACMDAAGYQMRMTYQPAERYWTFQWIEFGVFAALAAIAVVATILVLRRRDA